MVHRRLKKVNKWLIQLAEKRKGRPKTGKTIDESY